MSLTRMRRKFELQLKLLMWVVGLILVVGIFFWYGGMGSGPARQAQGAPAAMSDVVATVNGEPLTRELLWQQYVRLSGSTSIDIQRFGWTYWLAFEQAKGILLTQQAAKRMGVAASREAIDQQVKLRVDAQMAQVRARAKARGRQVPEGLRASIEERVRLGEEGLRYQLQEQGVKAKLGSRIPISDKDLAAYSERVRVKHILVGSVYDQGKKRRTDAEALAKAKALLKRIRAGESFESVARAESDDVSSAPNGGGIIAQDRATGKPGKELFRFPRGQLVKEFDQAAFTQKIGLVGEPVKTEFGCHLILVVERKRDTPKELEQNRQAYRSQIAAQHAEEAWPPFRRQESDRAKVQIKDPLVMAVRSLMNDPKTDRALAYMQKAVEEPGLWDQMAAAANYLLGNLLKGKGKYQQAADAYNEALDKPSNASEQIMMELAETYMKLKRKPDAIRSIRDAIDQAPDDQVQSTRAERMYTEMGRKDLADAEKKRREELLAKAAQEARSEAESAAPAAARAGAPEQPPAKGSGR